MPSELHNELARMAIRWLRSKVTGRGIRGGFEVPLDAGYVADAVALCSFQHRYAKAYIGEKHFERINAYETIVPEVLCVFEAKATRSDFLATFGSGPRHTNRKRPLGSLHWCVTGRHVAKVDELPDFWGLLSVCGHGLRLVRPALFQALQPYELEHAAYQVLWYAKPTHKPFSVPIYALVGNDLE